MRQKLVAGNWKSNGNRQFVEQLLGALKAHSDQVPAEVKVAVCPPSVYLTKAEELLRGTAFLLGAQNVSAFEEGAYTGEVTASMLKDVGCSLVIIGHSERRSLLAENESQFAEKIKLALNAGLQPVYCVGESLDQRRQGQALAVCREQLLAGLVAVTSEQAAQLVIAYEPVWAIGTGETASPEQVQEVHACLRQALRERFGEQAELIQILYGGSVKAANARELFALPDVDGGLIGGASLVADEFLAICKAGINA